jgi:hypothetical protein
VVFLWRFCEGFATNETSAPKTPDGRPPLWNTDRMTQEPDDANRRVVKKVVKKTVVRPISPQRSAQTFPTQRADQPNGQGATSSPAPRNPRRLRPARLATPTRTPTARAAAPASAPVNAPTPPSPAVPAPAQSAVPTPPPEVRVPPVSPPAAAPDVAVVTPGKPARAPKPPKAPRAKKAPKEKKPRKEKVARERRSLDLGARLSDLRHAITDRIGDGLAYVGDLIADGWHWLLRLRLPHLSPARGSAVTGALVGLVSVALGWGFYQLFSATRGTQAGGGWGFLALVFVAFVAFIAGELLLSGFGVPLPRVVSILSILLVLLLVLVFFIKLAAGLWAWLLIPALSALCFVASTSAMRVASQEKNDQRLPWEPTSESQVNLD